MISEAFLFCDVLDIPRNYGFSLSLQLGWCSRCLFSIARKALSLILAKSVLGIGALLS